MQGPCPGTAQGQSTAPWILSFALSVALSLPVPKPSGEESPGAGKAGAGTQPWGELPQQGGDWGSWRRRARATSRLTWGHAEILGTAQARGRFRATLHSHGRREVSHGAQYSPLGVLPRLPGELRGWELHKEVARLANEGLVGQVLRDLR